MRVAEALLVPPTPALPRKGVQREGFSRFPPPLRGRARVGGGSQTPWRTVVRTPRAAPKDPPPQPSPARGEGVLMSLSRCEFRQLGKKPLPLSHKGGGR